MNRHIKSTLAYQAPKRLVTRKALPVPYEETDQIELAKWLDMRGVLWTHPPMGGLRDKAVAARLQRMGAKAGVPDCLIFTRPPNMTQYVGTALELKRLRGGTVRKKQGQWLDDLEREHWYPVVARGLHDAIDQLERLGY